MPDAPLSARTGGRKESSALFDSLDLAKSGTLTPNELTARLSDFGLADELIEVLFYRLDTNHDGVVSKEEFEAGYGEYLKIVGSTSLPVAQALPSAGDAARGGAFVLQPSLVSPTVEPLPAAASVVQHAGGSIKIHKSSWAANAPSEDRSTVVLGDGFIFAGVWDGHGGTPCSEYIEDAAFPLFAEAKAAGKSNPDAWSECYVGLDAGYLETANKAADGEDGDAGGKTGAVAKSLFAGACCTGAFIDVREGLSCPADQHELLIHSAKDLPKTGAGIQRSDPYCRVLVNGVDVGRTPTRNRTQSPQWQASIQLRGLKPRPEVNTVRIEIMNKDRLSTDSDEGAIEFVGEGLSAFDGCRGRLGAYPVTLDGEPAGELMCQLQVPVPVSVGNLGDSRTVLGVYESGELRTQPLSVDHSVPNKQERARIEAEHPPSEARTSLDGAGVGAIDDKSGRVKKICAFTRSIGDCQMKDPAAAALFNSFRKSKLEPRPGTLVDSRAGVLDDPVWTTVKPYISCIPEHQDECLCDGFLIVACDGVWDEMSSHEAVQVVSELLANNAKSGGDANIADQFIELVLEKVVKRVKKNFPGEGGLTMAELKERPQGSKKWKGKKYCRSCLHDDITAVIVHFTSAAGGDAQTGVAQELAADKLDPATLAMREAFRSIDQDESGTLTAENVQALGERLGRSLTVEQAAAYIAAADKDGSGVLLLDEFAAWFETEAQNFAADRQGGEGGRHHSTLADELLMDLFESGGTEDEDGEGAAAEGAEVAAPEPEACGSGALKRTASDADVVGIFKALQKAGPADILAAAEGSLGLKGAEDPTVLDTAAVGKLLQGLMVARGGAVTEEAATLSAAECTREMGVPGPGGVTVALLIELVARNVES